MPRQLQPHRPMSELETENTVKNHYPIDRQPWNLQTSLPSLLTIWSRKRFHGGETELYNYYIISFGGIQMKPRFRRISFELSINFSWKRHPIIHELPLEWSEQTTWANSGLRHRASSCIKCFIHTLRMFISNKHAEHCCLFKLRPDRPKTTLGGVSCLRLTDVLYLRKISIKYRWQPDIW